jgi:hypothetical protein
MPTPSDCQVSSFTSLLQHEYGDVDIVVDEKIGHHLRAPVCSEACQPI